MSSAFAVSAGVLAAAPAHWRRIPLWTVVRRREKTGVVGKPLLSVYRDHGVVPKDSRDDNFNRPSDDLSRYQYVRPGDLVLNRMKAWQGSLAVSEHEGIVSPAYLVCGLSPAVQPRFLHYLLRSEPYVHLYRLLSQGVRPNQWDLDYDAFRSLTLLCPPLDEQRRITEFLDAEAGHFARVIEARARQSALLEARFQQIVDAAVTGYTSSLDIPADEWTPVKIGRICRMQSDHPFPSENFAADGTPLLRGVNVGVGRVDWNDVVCWDEKRHPIPRQFRLLAGDLVLGMDRPWISGGLRVAEVEQRDLPALLSQRVARLRGNGSVSMAYLRRVFGSSHFKTSVERQLTGVSVPHLSGDQIASFRFLLPGLPVQKLVAAGLDRQERLVVAFSDRVRRQREVMLERRRALITAAVTGQFDVTTTHPVWTTTW
ncbi:restriction endonuclease subunit S [Amycolatopsis taiwanensis]|uniref:restriction endonuclease subunit S n=1 Tax=Amycolatopsis taiwanensis TaxID=342230 RepID=UPI0004B03C60|nr:restriction endonuclease subunit S [Amycolatopsis taiwanensis]